MDNNKNNRKDYECFSPNQDSFLREKGFEPYREYVHYRTKAQCYVYRMTDELSKALTEWSNKGR